MIFNAYYCYCVIIYLVHHQEQEIAEEAQKRIEMYDEKKQRFADSAQKLKAEREQRILEKNAKLVEAREALYTVFLEHEKTKDDGTYFLF